MKSKELLNKKGLAYTGYTPRSIAISTLTLSDIAEIGLRALERVPRKITAFFNRSKIVKVFKSDCFQDPLDNYYIIQTTDGTLFIVDY